MEKDVRDADKRVDAALGAEALIAQIGCFPRPLAHLVVLRVEVQKVPPSSLFHSSDVEPVIDAGCGEV